MDEPPSTYAFCENVVVHFDWKELRLIGTVVALAVGMPLLTFLLSLYLLPFSTGSTKTYDDCDDCPICLNSLHLEQVGCFQCCGNPVHETCYTKYVRLRPAGTTDNRVAIAFQDTSRANCVFCRAPSTRVIGADGKVLEPPTGFVGRVPVYGQDEFRKAQLQTT